MKVLGEQSSQDIQETKVEQSMQIRTEAVWALFYYKQTASNIHQGKKRINQPPGRAWGRKAVECGGWVSGA